MGRTVGWVVVIVLVLVFARNRRELSRAFWLWVGKYAQLSILMAAAQLLDFPVNLALTPLFVLLFAPALVIQQILVPLRMPRVTFWIARWFGPVGMLKEAKAGAALYGALTLARRRRRAMPAILWLEQQAKQARTFRGASVVTAGLLAALRGDRRRARSLFLLADAMRRKFIPASARVVARDWLIANSAGSGNWREVIRLGLRGRDSTRWSYAVARIAERLVGDPKAWPAWRLWLCWIIAPRRRPTLALVRRALAVPAPEPSGDAGPAAEALPDALAVLACELSRNEGQDGRALGDAVGAVEAALDRPAARAALEQRLLALGGRQAPDAAVASFRKGVADLLVPIIEASPTLAAESGHPSAFDQAIEQVRARLFGDIDAQCKDYNERRRRAQSLDVLAEWSAWAVTRDCAERLLQLVPDSGAFAVSYDVRSGVQLRGVSAQHPQAAPARAPDVCLAGAAFRQRSVGIEVARRKHAGGRCLG